MNEEGKYRHLLTPEQLAAYESVQASLQGRASVSPDAPRDKPFIWLYSTALHDAPNVHPDDWERKWEVQSGLDNTCGMSLDTFEDALIGARLLALRTQLGWTLQRIRPVGGDWRNLLTCWCGWWTLIDGCYSDPIVEHVKTEHPEHPVVRG